MLFSCIKLDTTDVFLVGNGDGKPEEYFLVETMGVGSSDICLDKSGEGSPPDDSLVSENGSELESSGGRLSGE